jgi:hypothetical protein
MEKTQEKKILTLRNWKGLLIIWRSTDVNLEHILRNGIGNWEELVFGR